MGGSGFQGVAGIASLIFADSAKMAPGIVALSGADRSGIDKSVKPGDDFDSYANGAGARMQSFLTIA